MAEIRAKFWENLPLEELNREEWEALCDGCGLCCLVKLEEEESRHIYFTNLTCSLLDGQTCRCSEYENRYKKMPDCRAITPQSLRQIEWLPPTCAYRLREQGQPLFDWHPLISGNEESVHEAGISTRGWTISEEGIELEDYEDYLLEQPFAPYRNKIKK